MSHTEQHLRILSDRCVLKGFETKSLRKSITKTLIGAMEWTGKYNATLRNTETGMMLETTNRNRHN